MAGFWALQLALFFFSSLPLFSTASPGCSTVNFTVPIDVKPKPVSLPQLDLENPELIRDTINGLVGSAIDLLTVVPVKETYNIVSTYCEPENPSDVLQILVHGGVYTRTYWSGLDLPADLDPQRYSWVDYATKKGYATLAIDRLGNGDSTHPADGIIAASGYTNADVIHEIVTQIQAEGIQGSKYKKIVGVGHSLGSVATHLAAARYPDVFDAMILSGFSADFLDNAVKVFATTGILPADIVNPIKWGRLPPAYVTFSNKPGLHGVFYGPSGHYDPAVADFDWDTRGTATLGDVIDLFSSLEPSLYPNPVQIIIGEFDGLFCRGRSCGRGKHNTPGNTQSLYPNANFNYSITDNTKHVLNYHFSAPQTFQAAHDFIKQNVG